MKEFILGALGAIVGYYLSFGVHYLFDDAVWFCNQTACVRHIIDQ